MVVDHPMQSGHDRLGDAEQEHRSPPGCEPEVAAIAAASAEAILAAAGRACETRLEQLRSVLEERLGAFAVYQHDQLAALDARLADSERTALDLIGEVEARVRHDIGERIAEADAGIMRAGQALDEALAALAQRLAAVSDRLEDIVEAQSPGRIDAISDDLDGLRADHGALRGELERLRDEHIDGRDRLLVRMADLEARAAERVDVHTAVQIERLDEIERQLLALDPRVASAARVEPWAHRRVEPDTVHGHRLAGRARTVAPPPSMGLHGRGDSVGGDGVGEVREAVAPAVGVGGPEQSAVSAAPAARPDLAGPEVVGSWIDDAGDTDPWRSGRNPFAGPW